MIAEWDAVWQLNTGVRMEEEQGVIWGKIQGPGASRIEEWDVVWQLNTGVRKEEEQGAIWF